MPHFELVKSIMKNATIYTIVYVYVLVMILLGFSNISAIIEHRSDPNHTYGKRVRIENIVLEGIHD